MWGSEAFYSPVIRSWAFSEPVSHTGNFTVPVSFVPHLGGTGWLEWTGLGISFPLSQSGYDKSPGSGLVVSAEGRPG